MAPQEQKKAFERMLSEMKPLFWDTDIDSLDMERNAPFIISRLLNMGGMRGYIWVVDLFTERQIVDAVMHRRDMRPVVRNFMARRFNVPLDQLTCEPANSLDRRPRR